MVEPVYLNVFFASIVHANYTASFIFRELRAPVPIAIAFS
jgi:hypothetical protein